MTTGKKGISYPEAFTEPYRRVHIDSAQRGVPHFCFGCSSEMIIKRGEINRPHFAHKAGLVCDPDTALHEAAKMNIVEGFTEAVETGKEYTTGFGCDRCGGDIAVNIAEQGSGVASERSVVPGTRSDLSFRKSDGSCRLIVEIKVTHDIEIPTRQRYEESATPVLTVEPESWETLPRLRRGFFASSTINISQQGRICPRCKEQEKKYYNRLEHYKNMLVGMRPGHYNSTAQLQPIFKDRYGSQLYPWVEKKIRHYARQLIDLGFVQQAKRPTLFLYEIDGWSIYADIDSTYVLSIWKVDCKPAFMRSHKRDVVGSVY